MLPYFPIQQEQYKMTMGTQALDPEQVVVIDSVHYRDELALKKQLLNEEQDCYFQGPSETLEMQWETIELLLPVMARRYPEYFTLTIEGKQWRWQNRLLESESVFIPGDTESLPYAPLHWLGRQVQEDLLLMKDDAANGMPLVAGVLCFPNDWCLEEKLGQAFLLIHEPVPLFAEQIGRSALLLLERLKVGRSVWRTNWGIKGTARLNLLPRFASEQRQSCEQICAENIGECCFLRMERQTLSRLPQTKAVLFTVHTYQAPIIEVVQNREDAQRLLQVLETTPEEMMQYKNIQGFYEILVAYLRAQQKIVKENRKRVGEDIGIGNF